MIEIDIPGRRLELCVSEEELARRRAQWQPPRRELKGYLKKYARNVSSAAQGAIEVFDD